MPAAKQRPLQPLATAAIDADGIGTKFEGFGMRLMISFIVVASCQTLMCCCYHVVLGLNPQTERAEEYKAYLAQNERKVKAGLPASPSSSFIKALRRFFASFIDMLLLPFRLVVLFYRIALLHMTIPLQASPQPVLVHSDATADPSAAIELDNEDDTDTASETTAFNPSDITDRTLVETSSDQTHTTSGTETEIQAADKDDFEDQSLARVASEVTTDDSEASRTNEKSGIQAGTGWPHKDSTNDALPVVEEQPVITDDRYAASQLDGPAHASRTYAAVLSDPESNRDSAPAMIWETVVTAENSHPATRSIHSDSHDTRATSRPVLKDTSNTSSATANPNASTTTIGRHGAVRPDQIDDNEDLWPWERFAAIGS